MRRRTWVTRIVISTGSRPSTLTWPRSNPAVYARSPLQPSTSMCGRSAPPENRLATQPNVRVTGPCPRSIGPQAPKSVTSGRSAHSAAYGAGSPLPIAARASASSPSVALRSGGIVVDGAELIIERGWPSRPGRRIGNGY